MPNAREESFFRKKGLDFIAGVDEAGRGPLAGPVVAAAVILPKQYKIKGLDDSKKLSEKERERLFYIIQKKAVDIGIGIVDQKTIDKVNILQATLMAMKIAIESLSPRPDIVLIDGKQKTRTIIPQKCIIRGDGKCNCISAASIIAKVTRDKIMADMDKLYPLYGFKEHKGYGTKKHINKILTLGPCEIHRQSFDPIKSLFKTPEKT
ncbi:ribonuclease HII [candidate division WOR-1 bacterium RIFOXYA2_FULL_36_21]|uniref:Ribonuclease HII n=1 Tax=candidate division WOR-1 bacterium RIFOXYB2_FULL_36_35 TaxID=1802578 RepID=A0A1F4S2K9_UNCSA|nr:MAG: ribonuclease HII [candidate division WOR-1 bacterium RIFOXYA2_FULL_36_21]OGC13973.1 MAG: ribonuclease HII [candidate division WOR-1 bacterium RIFOXYB2_FULL_36_35]OGC18800.1 MAG: ribonuclease HII [candidate division WOR-1 bacterium RIFOXYA12_FULL_36_13]